MKSRALIVALSTVAMLVVGLPAASADQYQCDPECVISGTVRDVKGAPVPGVQVWKATGTSITSSGGDTTTTDSLGRYSFSQRSRTESLRIGVLEGYRTLDPRVSGAWSQSYYPGVGSLSEATVFTMGDRQELTGIDLVVHRGGEIYGQVTGDKGHIGSIVRITLFRRVVIDGVASFQEYRYAGDAVDHAYSRKDNFGPDGRPGSYYFGALPPGTYRVGLDGYTMNALPTWYGGADTLAAAKNIVIKDGQSVVADLKLTKGPQVTGRVVRPNGEPAIDVEVGFHRTDRDEQMARGAWDSATARTDREGRYTVDVAPGHYEIGPVNLELGDRTDDLLTVSRAGAVAPDVTLSTDPGYTIFHGLYEYESGGERHIGDGGVRVYRRAADGTWEQVKNVSIDYGNADRRFTLMVASEGGGEYTVGFGKSPHEVFLGGRMTLDTAETVQVGVDDVVTGLDWFAPGWGIMSGHVTVTGEPDTDWRGRVEVLQRIDGAWHVVASTPRVGYPLGRFEDLALLPGTYRFRFTGDERFADLYWPSSASLADADDVVVRAREPLVLEPAVLRPGAAAFTEVKPGMISGPAVVGTPLTVDPGTWSPAPETFDFQWKVAGADVPGATGDTFTPRPEDVGAEVSVRIRVSGTGHASVVRTLSASTVQAAPVPPSPWQSLLNSLFKPGGLSWLDRLLGRTG